MGAEQSSEGGALERIISKEKSFIKLLIRLSFSLLIKSSLKNMCKLHYVEQVGKYVGHTKSSIYIFLCTMIRLKKVGFFFFL